MKHAHPRHHRPVVSALGLGAWACPTSTAPPTAAERIATIHAALDAGVTLLDTGDFYGMGHNELLIREALRTARDRDDVPISVKFGALRDPDGSWIGVRRPARPPSRTSSPTRCSGSAPTTSTSTARARLDPDVPIEETVGAIAELVEAGYVRHIGLSEVGAETIRRAARRRTRSPTCRSSTR